MDNMSSFSEEIEKLTEDTKSYIDSIILYCERTGLEVEVVSKLVSGTLKAKIGMEANTLNLLKKPITESIPLPL